MAGVCKRQHGLSLIGLIVTSGVLVFLALLAMKVVPAYTEYFTILKNIKAVAAQGGSTVKEIQGNFGKRADIDDITAVDGKELDCEKNGDRWIVSVTYQKKVPLFSNVSLLFDFEATSGP